MLSYHLGGCIFSLVLPAGHTNTRHFAVDEPEHASVCFTPLPPYSVTTTIHTFYLLVRCHFRSVEHGAYQRFLEAHTFSQRILIVSIITARRSKGLLISISRVKAKCPCSVQGCSKIVNTTIQEPYSVPSKPPQDVMLQAYQLSFIGCQFETINKAHVGGGAGSISIA